MAIFVEYILILYICDFSDIDLVVIGTWTTLPLHTLENALLDAKISKSGQVRVLDKASVSNLHNFDLFKITPKGWEKRIAVYQTTISHLKTLTKRGVSIFIASKDEQTVLEGGNTYIF